MIRLGKVIIDAATIEFAIKDVDENGKPYLNCSFMSGANLKLALANEQLIDEMITNIYNYKCAVYEMEGFVYDTLEKKDDKPTMADSNVIEVQFGKKH